MPPGGRPGSVDHLHALSRACSDPLEPYAYVNQNSVMVRDVKVSIAYKRVKCFRAHVSVDPRYLTSELKIGGSQY
jgi:hypothetical protein